MTKHAIKTNASTTTGTTTPIAIFAPVDRPPVLGAVVEDLVADGAEDEVVGYT